MDRLPLELKEYVVGALVWGRPPVSVKDEKWEDGFNALLPLSHPLRNHLLPTSARTTATEAEQALARLSRTSKTFKSICEGFLEQVLGATIIGDQQNAVRPLQVTLCGLPRPGVGAFSLSPDDPSLSKDLAASVPCPALVIDAIRTFGTTLRALAFGHQTFYWTAAVLNALPEGALLQQLSVTYPHIEAPTEEDCRQVELAIKRCSRLTALSVARVGRETDYDGDYDEPEDEYIPSALRFLLGLPPSVKQVRLSGLEHVRFPESYVAIFKPPALAHLRLTRLVIDKCRIQNITLDLVESSSPTLEFLSLTFSCGKFETPITSTESTIVFERLRHISLTISDLELDGGVGPSMLPAHWKVPAIQHLHCSELDFVDLEEAEDQGQDLLRRLDDMLGTLQYLYIRLYQGPELREMPFDVEALQSRLRNRGVDATLEVTY